MDYRMQADDSADTANGEKAYIKQPGRNMRKSPKRFCLLTFVLIGDAPVTEISVTCGTKRKFAEVNASLVLNFGI